MKIIYIKNISAGVVDIHSSDSSVQLSLSSGQVQELTIDVQDLLYDTDWSEYFVTATPVLAGLDEDRIQRSSDISVPFIASLLAARVKYLSNGVDYLVDPETAIKSTMLEWIPIESVAISGGSDHTINIPSNCSQIKIDFEVDAVSVTSTNPAVFARMNGDANTNYSSTIGYFASPGSAGAFCQVTDKAHVMYPGGMYADYPARGTWHCLVRSGQYRYWDCQTGNAEANGSENAILMRGDWLNTADDLTTIVISSIGCTARLSISYKPEGVAFNLPSTVEEVTGDMPDPSSMDAGKWYIKTEA